MIRSILIPLLFLSAYALHAQTDTIRYDNLPHPFDGQLLAASLFEGELDAVFTARFSPTEKCRLVGAIAGFSVVKFLPASGNDTLVVRVYEDTPVPPKLLVVGTYTADLGDTGFPPGNINYINPLSSGARDQLRVDFTPPLVIAPKRDFRIGIALRSKQLMALPPFARWNGFCVLTNPFQQEYDRYGRYRTLADSRLNAIYPVTTSANATLFLRALVEYDATLPNTTLTGLDRPASATGLTLRPNHPNPFRDATTLEFELEREEAVTLTVTDILGRTIETLAEGVLRAGPHRVEYLPGNARAQGAGVVFATLRAGSRSVTRMMTRLR